MSLLRRLTGRFPSVVIARRNVSRARTRSLLAAAAIMIGVVAIAGIGAGGAAFKQSQLDRIQEQGATNVYVSPGFDKEDRHFDRTDLMRIDETVGGAGIVATESRSMEYRRRSNRERGVSVTYLDDPRRLYDVAAGEIPKNWRRSAVVSREFAADNDLEPGDRIVLAPETDEDETGEFRAYRVTAVLAETQAFGVDQVYLPIEATGDRQYGQVRITTQSVEEAEAAATALREEFNGRKDTLIVFELTSLVRLFTSIVNGINLFLAGLGSLSLLVAGVSIANTMLMSVTKRREEIGVLRAVGYSKVDILRILLVEAALLGAIGAGIGIALALLVVLAANAIFLGSPFAFTSGSLLYLVGAVVFGIGTSLVAGAYPAWRAANERPVEALRG
ncbi:ABC transporter permease [Halorientalis pallida]|uniref:FtsX-like permease family protein n=1 Tax=Halorientalis pallida TaxID=2479928 RepID=A0A498KYN1_9EURY|nr:FtsX-like permease family protein [Halorientalis pallida]RXK49300.1 FtsX-like permease family protein [Halorientalis pallida]